MENPKLLKVKEFRPNITDQNDRRNLKRARDDFETLVTKCYNNLAFPCFAGVPVLDPKRGVVGLELFAMGEPLKEFFTDDKKETLLSKLQESMVEVLAKMNDLADENDQENLTGVATEVVEELAKPLKPVFYMNSSEMDTYFSALKSSVARKDGVKIKRKWPKVVDGHVIEPTSLPSFDAFVESVLPSSQYFGAKTKFVAGNLLWRQQIVCAYLLEQNGYNYNTYAHNVTEDHVAKTWKLTDLIEIGRNPKETAKLNVVKRNRKNKLDNIGQLVQEVIEQEQNAPDEREHNDTAGLEEEQDENTGAPENIEENHDSRDEQENEALDNSLLGSHSSGSPHVSRESSLSFDARVFQMEVEENHEKEKKIVISEMKEAGNDLITFSSGEEREGGYILQAYDLLYVEAAKCYRATLSDGSKATDRVLFNSLLNDKVEEDLKEKKNLVKVTSHRIFNSSMIIIDDFDPYWDAKNEILMTPQLLSKDYLKHISEMEADKSYATSPGLLDRKVTKRDPRKLQVKNKTVGR